MNLQFFITDSLLFLFYIKKRTHRGLFYYIFLFYVEIFIRRQSQHGLIRSNPSAIALRKINDLSGGIKGAEYNNYERGFAQEDDSIIGGQLKRKSTVVMWTSLTERHQNHFDLMSCWERRRRSEVE